MTNDLLSLGQLVEALVNRTIGDRWEAMRVENQRLQRRVGELEAEVKSLRLKVPVTEAEAKAQYQKVTP